MPRTCHCIDFSREFWFGFDDIGSSPHFEWITSKIQCHGFQGFPLTSRQKKFKDLHTLNAFCLFEKEDLIRVPIMEGISSCTIKSTIASSRIQKYTSQ